jgi:aminoglycoside phosphotransferase (APT) family kinase protein
MPATAQPGSSDGTSAPPLDLERLDAYLSAHVGGFTGLRSASRLLGGNSNPIWRIEAASGNYVLRTQPAGQLLKSAHALDREFRVMAALHGSPVPVARPHVLCNDLDVIGVQFYVMDLVSGRVHRDVALPEWPRDSRASIYEAALDMLATIHRTDVDALGLRDFGRPGNYFERQFHRWSQQYRTAVPEGEPEMDRLIERLGTVMPADDRPAVLLHGDSRLDNLMFDVRTGQVVAVLDWELSTLGHPLADLGQFLAVQELAHDYLLPGLGGLDRAALGIPTRHELAARYLRTMDMDSQVDLRPHMAFAMFRQAAMSAGLRRRAQLGTAVADSARLFGDTMDVFARLGLRLLDGAVD